MKVEEIQRLIDDFKQSELMSLELETKDFKLKLSKNKDGQTVKNKNITKTEKDLVVNNKNEGTYNNTKIHYIKSPLIGTYYEASEPNAKPFVKIGQSVKKGEVIAIVEAMKIMNEITSDIDGVVKEILVENKAPIGYNQKLIKVEKL